MVNMINRKMATIFISVVLGLSIIGLITILSQASFSLINFNDQNKEPKAQPHLIYGPGINITRTDNLGFTHKYTDSHNLKIRSALGAQLTTKQLIDSNYSIVATSIALFTNTNGTTNNQIEVGIFKGNTALGSSMVPQGFIVNWVNGEKHDVVLLGDVPKYVEISVDENGVVFITVDGDVRQYAHIQKQYVYDFGYSWLEEIYK